MDTDSIPSTADTRVLVASGYGQDQVPSDGRSWPAGHFSLGTQVKGHLARGPKETVTTLSREAQMALVPRSPPLAPPREDAAVSQAQSGDPGRSAPRETGTRDNRPGDGPPRLGSGQGAAAAAGTGGCERRQVTPSPWVGLLYGQEARLATGSPRPEAQQGGAIPRGLPELGRHEVPVASGPSGTWGGTGRDARLRPSLTQPLASLDEDGRPAAGLSCTARPVQPFA